MYQVNDRVFINDPRTTDHGKRATVVAIGLDYAYPCQARIDGDGFAFWYTEDQLSAEPIRTQVPQAAAEPTGPVCDFDRTGAGIGGIGRLEEKPIVPTEAALERYERLEAQATYCRRCGQSDAFDGAMFTTDPASGLCDDCF